MEILIYVYFFLVGITLGSFFNVVGLRISEGKSIVKPRSSCPNCGHELGWLELIPLFSYLFLRGKCKNCKSKISIKYFLFELLTGLLFVYAYWMTGLNTQFIVALTFISLFIIITVSDLAYMLIEDKVVVFFLILILIERIFIPLPADFITFGLPHYVETLLGGAIGFGMLFMIAYGGSKVFKKEVMGGGDIKLYGIIGLVLGTKLTVFSLFFASVLGTIIGYTLIFMKALKKDTPVPFGPYIALSCLITYFYGTDIINWYLGLFKM